MPGIVVKYKCDACKGDGVYRGFGRCFRCDGKGFQTDEDVRRNKYHDNQKRKIGTENEVCAQGFY